MKSRIFGITVLALLVVFTVLYSLLITDKTKELITLSDALPQEKKSEENDDYWKNVKETVTPLSDAWNENMPLLGTVIALDQLDRADMAMTALRASVISRETGAYLAALYEWKDALWRIHRQQGISIDSVL